MSSRSSTRSIWFARTGSCHAGLVGSASIDTLAAVATHERELIHVDVVHDGEEPRAQIAPRPPHAPLLPPSRERVLHEVVGARRLARQHPRVAAQARNRGNQVRLRQARSIVGGGWRHESASGSRTAGTRDCQSYSTRRVGPLPAPATRVPTGSARRHIPMRVARRSHQEHRGEPEEDEESARIRHGGDEHRRADRRIAAQPSSSSSVSARPSARRASGSASSRAP